MNDVVDHAYEPWTSDGGWTVCIYWEDGRICDRPKEEHASASEEVEADA